MLAIWFHRWIHSEAGKYADVGHGEDIDVACPPMLYAIYLVRCIVTNLSRLVSLHPNADVELEK
jgi:hypothetical protein